MGTESLASSAMTESAVSFVITEVSAPEALLYGLFMMVMVFALLFVIYGLVKLFSFAMGFFVKQKHEHKN